MQIAFKSGMSQFVCFTRVHLPRPTTSNPVSDAHDMMRV